MQTEAHSSGVSQTRFEAFSDGVFAIVITLLVLELRVHENVTAEHLRHELLEQLPRLGAYVLTFFSVGVFWVAHHLMLGSAKRVDRLLLWINNVFLMVVALLPFSAGVLGAYPRTREAVVLYGSNMVIVEIFLIWIWCHIVRHLKHEGIPAALIQSGFRRPQIGLIIYAAGALLGAIGLPLVGITLFCVAPLSYVRLQILLDRPLNQ